MTSFEAQPVSTNFGQDPPTPPKARPISNGAARSSSISKRFFRIGKAALSPSEPLPPVPLASNPITSNPPLAAETHLNQAPSTKSAYPPPLSALPPLPAGARPERTPPPEVWTAPDFAGRSVFIAGANSSSRPLSKGHPHSPPISTHSHSQNGSTGSSNPSLSALRSSSHGRRSSRHTTSSTSTTSQELKGVKPGEIFDWEGMSRSYRETNGASPAGTPVVPAKRDPQGSKIGVNVDAAVLKELPSRRESLMALKGFKAVPPQLSTVHGPSSGKSIVSPLTPPKDKAPVGSFTAQNGGFQSKPGGASYSALSAFYGSSTPPVTPSAAVIAPISPPESDTTSPVLSRTHRLASVSHTIASSTTTPKQAETLSPTLESSIALKDATRIQCKIPSQPISIPSTTLAPLAPPFHHIPKGAGEENLSTTLAPPASSQSFAQAQSPSVLSNRPALPWNSEAKSKSVDPIFNRRPQTPPESPPESETSHREYSGSSVLEASPSVPNASGVIPTSLATVTFPPSDPPVSPTTSYANPAKVRPVSSQADDRSSFCTARSEQTPQTSPTTFHRQLHSERNSVTSEISLDTIAPLEIPSLEVQASTDSESGDEVDIPRREAELPLDAQASPEDITDPEGMDDSQLLAAEDTFMRGTEADSVDEDALKPRFEFAFACYPDTILASLLYHLRYEDFRSLRRVSRIMKRCVEGEAKELVLQRYLGPVGYRTQSFVDTPLLPSNQSRHSSPDTNGSSQARGSLQSGSSRRSSSNKKDLVTGSGLIDGEPEVRGRPEEIVLNLGDLDAFRSGMGYTTREFVKWGKVHSKNHSLPHDILQMVKTSTRAWNRVVLRIRAQSDIRPGDIVIRPPYVFPLLKDSLQIYKVGRAAMLKVWVPCKAAWMNDEEVVECEREVWRSGVWQYLKKGDVVHNVAIGEFGNEGKLICDGKFLRDFQFTYDKIGHLPPWLDMLAFPPGYFHNIVASSGSNPVFYVCLNSFVAQIRENLALCNEKVQISSPQGSYIVKKFIYRSTFKLKSGSIIGQAGGTGGFGPGGIEVAHEDWIGLVVLETEGSTEHATSLMASCTSTHSTPWRFIREKSRPGRVLLRPVVELEERI